MLTLGNAAYFRATVCKMTSSVDIMVVCICFCGYTIDDTDPLLRLDDIDLSLKTIHTP